MLRRVGIVAALAGGALVLSGCGSEKEPAAVAVTPGTPVPSPSWTPPPAGMWTESDLAEGREVPPEEMDRLRPVIETPEEPETITHNTEKGAKDTVEFLAQLIVAANERGEPELLDKYMTDTCFNCKELYNSISRTAAKSTRARCRSHSIRTSKIEEGQGEVPYYELEVAHADRTCLSFDSNSNVIKQEHADEEDKLWYVVQYLDGKWTPYLLSMTEKPDYADN